MFVYIYSVFVFSCAGIGLATDWSPVQGFLSTVYKIKKLKWNEVIHECIMLQREQQEYDWTYPWILINQAPHHEDVSKSASTDPPFFTSTLDRG
jgi:hypothetical protein